MFVTHNPLNQDQIFIKEMKEAQSSRKSAVNYVSAELKSNPDFLNAAWHGDAFLEGQDGTVYYLAALLNDGNSLWEARWPVSIYMDHGAIQTRKSFLFQVALPTNA